MFAVAIVLGIAAIGWRYIEARIPLLGSTLQTTTSSRVVWFFAGIVPALIGGVLLSDLLRRRRENQTKVLPPGWLEVMGAKDFRSARLGRPICLHKERDSQRVAGA